MALDDNIFILTQIALFEGLEREQLRLLAFGAETERLDRGQLLFREGDNADGAYIILSGAVNLIRKRNSDHVLIRTARQGAILGEMALIAETNRLTDAVAEQHCVLMKLDRSIFRRVLIEYPEIAALLHARISDNLSAMIARIGELSPNFR